MPSFNKLRRLEFDCLIVPPWGIRNFCAFIQRYERKKQYRILFPYFDGADIEFLISIYDKMDDFVNPQTYTFDWKLIQTESQKCIHSDKEDFSSQQPTERRFNYFVNIPFVNSNGKHEFWIKVFRNKELICDWENIANFNIFDYDVTIRDGILVITSAIIGGIIGGALTWIITNFIQ